jgi:DNA-directed RNA polymerase subunit alpha
MSNALATSINERASEEFFRKAQDAEKEGNAEKALGFYERALGENPDHELACFQLAKLYDRRGDDTKAIELYERICTSEPVHVNALVNLAILYEDNNMYDDARRCLEAVVKTNPDHQRAKLYLKDVLSARRMFADDDDHTGNGAAMDILVSEFDLSVRSRNALKKMNVRTLGDLLRVSEQDLLSFKNFGDTSLNEIKNMLAARGLRLGQAADGGSTAPAILGSSSTSKPASSDPANDAADEILAKNLQDLELSVRSRKALQRLNINTIGELSSRTEDELLGCKNFGQTSLNELKAVLAQYGITFRKLPK